MAAFIDPRTHQMGIRVVCTEQSIDFDQQVEIMDDSEYHLIR